MRPVYHVLAKRWAHGWELHIDGVGVTQARWPGEAERMARSLIEINDDVPPDSFDLTWSTESPDPDFLAAVA